MSNVFNPNVSATQLILMSDPVHAMASDTSGVASLIGPLSSGNKNQYQVMNLNLEFVVNLVHGNEKACDRCIDLSEKEKLEKHMFQILKVLFVVVGKYVNQAFDQNLLQFVGGSNSRYNPKQQDPNPNFLLLCQVANSILQRLEQHLEIIVIPVVSSNISIRMECIRLRDELFIPIENKVVRGLEFQLKQILDRIKAILEKDHQKTDYSRKDQEFSNEEVTLACAHTCEFLKSQMKIINETLFGMNREYFLTECGLQFYRILTTHLKNSNVITATGAIRLMKDMKEYVRVVSKFEVLVIEDLFENLKEISSLYLVKPENIENVLLEFEKKHMSKEELLSFIKLREDFKKNNLQRLPFF